MLLDNLNTLFENKKKKLDELFEFINLFVIYGNGILSQDLKKLDQVTF